MKSMLSMSMVLISVLLSGSSCNPSGIDRGQIPKGLRRELAGYKPTQEFAFDSSFQKWVYIGPEFKIRTAKWVRIKEWPRPGNYTSEDTAKMLDNLMREGK